MKRTTVVQRGKGGEGLIDPVTHRAQKRRITKLERDARDFTFIIEKKKPERTPRAEKKREAEGVPCLCKYPLLTMGEGRLGREKRVIQLTLFLIKEEDMRARGYLFPYECKHL